MDLNTICWILAAVLGLVAVFLEKKYNLFSEAFNEKNDPSNISLKDFIEKTVNDIEDAVKSISDRNKRQYHIRGSEFRDQYNTMGDIEFDVSIVVTKDSKAKVDGKLGNNGLSGGVSMATSNKSGSTHRIKFAVSCSQFDEQCIARAEALNIGKFKDDKK